MYVSQHFLTIYKKKTPPRPYQWLGRSSDWQKTSHAKSVRKALVSRAFRFEAKVNLDLELFGELVSECLKELHMFAAEDLKHPFLMGRFAYLVGEPDVGNQRSCLANYSEKPTPPCAVIHQNSVRI